MEEGLIGGFVDAVDLKRRTKAFALRCMRLADSLPPGKPSGRTVAGQLVRCGTSVAANYRSACRARLKAEFISKLGIVEEEVDESAFWLELVVEGGLLPANRVADLLDEATQFMRIIAKSRLTAKSSVRDQKSPPRGPDPI